VSEVTLVDVPTLLVLGMQKKGRYADTPSVIGEIVQYARANGAQLAGMPVALMHEPGREAAMQADHDGTAVIDVAFPIAGPVPSGERVKCYGLPGGRMAKIVHKGPYDACGSAYGALFEWLAKNGLQVTGLPREVSLNDPRTVKPEELLIEIYAPVD
jgi:effector-binding domain-containing protein